MVCDKHFIFIFYIHNRIELRESKRYIICIRERFRLRQLGRSAVAGLASDVLDVFLVRMNISITHCFGAGVAVDAVQGVFAFRELGNGLIVIMQAISRLVSPLDKCHSA